MKQSSNPYSQMEKDLSKHFEKQLVRLCFDTFSRFQEGGSDPREATVLVVAALLDTAARFLAVCVPATLPLGIGKEFEELVLSHRLKLGTDLDTEIERRRKQ